MPDIITLRLDRELIKRVRAIAVDNKTTVSAWIRHLVTRAIAEPDDFGLARKRAMKAMARPIPIRRATVLPRERAHVR